MPWPGAGGAPYYNVVGIDPQLRDPEGGDFRVQPGSPALGYGCRVFAEPRGATAAGAAAGWEAGNEPDARPTFAGGERRGTISVSGLIAVDTVWSADTVLVTGEVEIADGVTLDIVPGTDVLFTGWYALTVQGRVRAIGTASEPIRFDSTHPELFQPDLTLAGAWGGLRFHDTPASNGWSRLEWCELAHAKGVDSRRQGGALSLIGCSVLEARNCVFRDNVAEYGAVLYAERSANPLLTGCLMHGNGGLTAGAVLFLVDSYPRLYQCTLTGNPSLNQDIYYDTAAVHAYHSKPTIHGCILYDNYCSFFLPLQIREGKAFYTRWCDIEFGMEGEGDFDLPPQFAGAGAHPYALASSSPCVDAGPLETPEVNLLPVDLAGMPRPAAGRFDVGAYEWSDPAVVPDAPGGATGVSRRAHLRAAPNPSAAEVTIRFTLVETGPFRLTLHDLTGRELALLAEGSAGPGEQAVCLPRVLGPGEPPASTGGAAMAASGRSNAGGPGGRVLGGGVVWVRLSRPGVPPESIRLVRIR